MRKTIFLVLIIMTLMVGACIVSPGHRGEVGVSIAPPLPLVVELQFPDELYFYSDYYYHYRDNDWYYSRSKNGPWDHLPRDRHPKEVRYKGHDGDRGGDDKGHGEKRGYDQHDRD